MLQRHCRARKMQTFNSNIAAIFQKHCRDMELKIFNSADVATTMKETFKTYFN